MAGEDLTRAGPRRARPAAAGLAVAGPAVARPGIVSRRRRLPRAVDRCLLLLPPLPLLLLLQMMMMLLLPLLLASTGDLMPWPMVERNQRSRLGMPSTSIACAAAVIPETKVHVCCALVAWRCTIKVDSQNKQMTVHRRPGKQVFLGNN